MLGKVVEALARVRSLTVEECERAFGCELQADEQDSRQYRATCPRLGVCLLDVRIGSTGGVVVANFAEDHQAELAREAASLGEPVDFDIVSPPLAGEGAPSWERKWSVAHTVREAKIWFGHELVNGVENLVYVSRIFEF